MGQPESSSDRMDTFLQVAGMSPLLNKTQSPKDMPTSGGSDWWIYTGYQIWPLGPSEDSSKGPQNSPLLPPLIDSSLGQFCFFLFLSKVSIGPKNIPNELPKW